LATIQPKHSVSTGWQLTGIYCCFVMNKGFNAWIYPWVWIGGGALSLVLTVYGCLVWMMLDYRIPGDLCLGLCLILPFPCFLIGLRSMRWSAALLWFVFVALWLTRTQIHPNPELNPLDRLGALYLCPAIAVQLAVFSAPKKEFPVSPE
jgi:hypothetical protein